MAEQIASLVLLFLAGCWCGTLIYLLAMTVLWWTRAADELYPRVQQLCKVAERLSWVVTGWYMVWLILWFGARVDQLGN